MAGKIVLDTKTDEAIKIVKEENEETNSILRTMGTAIGGNSGGSNGTSAKKIQKEARETQKAAQEVNKAIDEAQKAIIKAKKITNMKGQEISINDALASLNGQTSIKGVNKNTKGYYGRVEDLEKTIESVYGKLTELKSKGAEDIAHSEHGEFVKWQRELVNVGNALSAMVAVTSGDNLKVLDEIDPSKLKEVTETYLKMSKVTDEIFDAFKDASEKVPYSPKSKSTSFPT